MNGGMAFICATCVVAFSAALPSRAPTEPMPASPIPAAGATLAPIGEDEAPTPNPTASSSPKLIGHVIVSAFCASFVEHFNVAARTMVADDTKLDDAVAAVRGYEDDYSRLDGASRAWDHRLQLIAALKELLDTIPKTQAAVNDL